MKRWSSCPRILKRKTLFTLLAGTGCLGVSIFVFFLYGDHMLLILGSAFFSGCLLQSGSLCHTIVHEKYDTVTGVCVGSCSSTLRRYRKIFLIDDSGNETTLLLGRQEPIRRGALYRFYFQTASQKPFGNEQLDAALSSHAFLGYEELPQNRLCAPAK